MKNLISLANCIKISIPEIVLQDFGRLFGNLQDYTK